jgi:hypothetical protein
VATYDRPGAAAFLARPDQLGSGAPAASTLPQLPIPYVIGPNKKASYEEDDLRSYSKKIKAKAVRRMGGRRRQPAVTTS